MFCDYCCIGVCGMLFHVVFTCVCSCVSLQVVLHGRVCFDLFVRLFLRCGHPCTITMCCSHLYVLLSVLYHCKPLWCKWACLYDMSWFLFTCVDVMIVCLSVFSLLCVFWEVLGGAWGRLWSRLDPLGHLPDIEGALGQVKGANDKTWCDKAIRCRTIVIFHWFR